MPVQRPDRSIGALHLAIALLVTGWEQSVGEYLAAQRNSVQGAATGRRIDSLWDAFFEILWLNAGQPPDIRYLSWLLKSMQGGTIV